MSGMGYWVPHWFFALRMGVPSALGLSTVHAYDILRSEVWRDDTKGPGKLPEMRRQGHLVSSLSQTELAERLDFGRKQAWKLLDRLRRLGWVKDFGTKSRDSNVMVYHLGELVSSAGERGEQGTTEVFFADEWILRLHEALRKHSRETLEDRPAEYNSLPFAKRLEFTKTYVERAMREPLRLVK